MALTLLLEAVNIFFKICANGNLFVCYAVLFTYSFTFFLFSVVLPLFLLSRHPFLAFCGSKIKKRPGVVPGLTVNDKLSSGGEVDDNAGHIGRIALGSAGNGEEGSAISDGNGNDLAFDLVGGASG